MPSKSTAAQIPSATRIPMTNAEPAISVPPMRFLPARMPSAIKPTSAKPPTTPTEIRPVVKIGVQSCR